MVLLNTTGTAAIKPPYVKVSLEELEELHEKACRYDELLPEVDVLLKNDTAKSKQITLLEEKVKLTEEERDSYKESNEEKEKEINKLKKGVIFRNIAIGVVTAILIIVSAK